MCHTTAAVWYHIQSDIESVVALAQVLPCKTKLTLGRPLKLKLFQLRISSKKKKKKTKRKKEKEEGRRRKEEGRMKKEAHKSEKCKTA